ncbi:hypothetical protein [Kaarinaea lacus]
MPKSNGGIDFSFTLTLDPTIKPKWIEALKFDHTVLVKEKSIPPLDFGKWIYDGYIRTAYKEMGLDYEKDLAYIRDPKPENMKLHAAEIWHKDKGIITYSSITDMLDAVKNYKEDKTLRASYVYDDVTGLKLFGKVAIYVKSKDGKFTAFMRKPDAEKFIASKGGELYTFTMLATAEKNVSIAKLN